MNRRELTQLGALTAAVAWLPACVGGTDDASLGPDPAGAGALTEEGAFASGNAARVFAPEGRSFTLAPLHNYVDVVDSYGIRIARIGKPSRAPTDSMGNVSGPVAAAWSEPSGRLLVLERGNARVQAFGLSGGSLGVLTAVDPAADLAIDGQNGTFYVAASSTHRIQVFSARGGATRTIGRFGTDGAGLNGPVSVALAPNGAVHVVDAGSASVKVFTAGGSFVGNYGDGDLVGPRAVRFDAAGRAWVADTIGASLKVYDAEGRLQSSVSPRFANGRRGAPVALSVRTDGTIYAALVAAA